MRSICIITSIIITACSGSTAEGERYQEVDQSHGVYLDRETDVLCQWREEECEPVRGTLVVAGACEPSNVSVAMPVWWPSLVENTGAEMVATMMHADGSGGTVHLVPHDTTGVIQSWIEPSGICIWDPCAKLVAGYQVEEDYTSADVP